jgi:integrase
MAAPNGTRGLGRLYLRGDTWWLDLSVRGKKVRMSTGVRGGTKEHPPKDAELYRASKLMEIGRGNGAGLMAHALTFDELAKMLEERYRAEGRKSLETMLGRLKYLRQGFAGWKAMEITPDQVMAYALRRREAGAAVASINTELAYLARSFSIAREYGRLPYVPRIPHLPGARVRQGFLEDAQLAAILRHLRPEHQAPILFLRLTGWRLREGLDLEWRRVDWGAEEVRLETSKTGEPRTLPFASYEPLKELLLRQRATAEKLISLGILTPYVFPRAGAGVITSRCLQSAWNRARKKAGVPWAMIHDLRRTVVRAMEQAHISRPVAMAITGHKSENIYRRYAIVARADVQAGLRQLPQTTTAWDTTPGGVDRPKPQ